MPSGDEATDGRYTQRRRTIKAGRVWFNNEQSVMDCQVRDLSATGAKLRFVEPFACPERVKLQLPDGEQKGIFLRAERIWVRRTEIGVRFTDGDMFDGATRTF